MSNRRSCTKTRGTTRVNINLKSSRGITRPQAAEYATLTLQIIEIKLTSQATSMVEFKQDRREQDAADLGDLDSAPADDSLPKKVGELRCQES